MRSFSKYDVIVIGAGHNGLVTAAYLAKAGKRVLVLERRLQVGGACVTEEVIPGFKISTTSYVCSLLRPEIVEELELKKFGFKLLLRDPSSVSLFPDGDHFYFWRDPKKTHAEIKRLSQKDAQIWEKYHKDLEVIAGFIEPLMLKPALDPQTRKLGELLALAKMGLRLRRTPDVLQALMKIFTLSVKDYLDTYFESEKLKATLATDGVIGAYAGPYTPGTAYVLFHHVMGEAEGVKGAWGYVEGGMGSITQALLKSARRYGAEVITDASVKEVEIEDQKVKGVILEDGREFHASCIVSNADPKRTFLNLISPRYLPSDFLETIQKIKCRGASFKINLALEGLPNWKAIPGEELGPQHRGTVHLTPTIDYIEKAWDDAKFGRTSLKPVIECTLPTSVDRTLAPQGKHILGLFVQYAPYELKETTWEVEKPVFIDRCLTVLEEYAPGIKNKIIGIHALSPKDLESEYAMTGGNIFHGEMSLDQLLFMRPHPKFLRYQTPIHGLYLCGSGTHPGGGVMGSPGYLAAKSILTSRP